MIDFEVFVKFMLSFSVSISFLLISFGIFRTLVEFSFALRELKKIASNFNNFIESASSDYANLKNSLMRLTSLKNYFQIIFSFLQKIKK